MDDEAAERIAAALERIARALEQAVFKTTVEDVRETARLLAEDLRRDHQG